MKIKDLLTKIGITEEAEQSKAIEHIESYVKSQTKDTETNMQQRINALTKEKHELKATISDLTAKVEVAETQQIDLTKQITELSDYKSKYESFQSERTKTLRAKQEQILKRLDIPETDKLFERAKKVKDKLIIKDKLEDYTADEIKKNVEIFDIYVDAGFFEAVTDQDTELPPTGDKGTTTKCKGGIVSRTLKK
jgi:hypothetical protein